MSRPLPILAALGVLALAPAALAQHPTAAPAALAPAAASRNLQGDQASWINDPHMHAFYDLTVQAFAGGPAKVDTADYQKKAYAIFADFGVSRGVPPEHMVDHLKLIPGQMVQIVKEDPKVLASYQNFVDAAFGPQ